MDPPSFMSNDVADSLYTGAFGKFAVMSTGIPYRSVEELPSELKTWVLTEHPNTTHVRLGPTLGSERDNRMIWSLSGWENPNGDDIQPTWRSLVNTQWRKT